MGSDERGRGGMEDTETDCDHLPDRLPAVLVPLFPQRNGLPHAPESDRAYADPGGVATDRALLRNCGTAHLLLFYPRGDRDFGVAARRLLADPFAFPCPWRGSVRHADQCGVPA